MNKRKLSTLALCAGLTLSLVSCSKKDNPTPVKPDLQIKTATDLNGSSGNVYYSLANNEQITGPDTLSTKWDIKFKSTNILVNSGSSGSGNTQAQIMNSTFDNVIVAPTDGYQSDASSTNAISGWYKYTAETEPQHAILPVPGKIVILKTTDGKYAKMEIISYYKGNPNTTTPEFANLATRPASRYYTFRFAIQTDGSTDLK